MTDTMTDERALELVRWLTNGSDGSPPPPDVTLQQAYDHIAARLKAAQEPVAWVCEKQHVGYTSTRVALDKESAAAEIADGATVIPLYTAPPPPALPEMTEEDVWEALKTWSNSEGGFKGHKAVLESYRARLMAKAVPNG